MPSQNDREFYIGKTSELEKAGGRFAPVTTIHLISKDIGPISLSWKGHTFIRDGKPGKIRPYLAKVYAAMRDMLTSNFEWKVYSETVTLVFDEGEDVQAQVYRAVPEGKNWNYYLLSLNQLPAWYDLASSPIRQSFRELVQDAGYLVLGEAGSDAALNFGILAEDMVRPLAVWVIGSEVSSGLSPELHAVYNLAEAFTRAVEQKHQWIKKQKAEG